MKGCWKGKVNVYKGMARFIDAKTVEFHGVTITADRFMIAAGGTPFVPEFPGREYVLVSDDSNTLTK